MACMIMQNYRLVKANSRWQKIVFHLECLPTPTHLNQTSKKKKKTESSKIAPTNPKVIVVVIKRLFTTLYYIPIQGSPWPQTKCPVISNFGFWLLKCQDDLLIFINNRSKDPYLKVFGKPLPIFHLILHYFFKKNVNFVLFFYLEHLLLQTSSQYIFMSYLYTC